MRPLCISQCRGGDRLTSEFGTDPEHSNDRHAGLHGDYLAPEHAPFIRRLIWSDQLYWLGHVASHMYILRLLSPCLFGEGVRVGVRLDMPFSPVHVVVGLAGLPDCISTVLVQGLHHQIEAAACA